LAHRDQAVAIFRPDGELLDRALFGARCVRRVDQADKRRRRAPRATDLPSGDMPPALTLTLTLTHDRPNIGQRAVESESLRHQGS
jgi:hypothetical protein